MNGFFAVCATIALFLCIVLIAVAWAAAWAIAIIWSVNILGGSLEYNWQTVVAVMVIVQVVSLLFKSSRKEQ